METKLLADQAHAVLAEAKDRLVGLASHTSEAGGGAAVTRYWKSGAIDCQKIPELKAIDLEQSRVGPREKRRVTAT